MRKYMVVFAIAIMAAPFASADFGSASGSFSVTPVGGTLNATFNIDVTTTGAATPGYNSADVFQFIAQLYQTNGTTTTTSTIDIATAIRTLSSPSNYFNYSNTLTAPFADTWLWWARFAATNTFQCPVTTGGVNCYWSTTTIGTGSEILDPTQPTATPDPNAGGAPIPTTSVPGLVILGMILAGLGVWMLRRN